ncbi:MAG: hypothetical protein ACI4GA_07570 [Acutalibacteraceae bacterium]|nr:hypothetical protein [Oscillospiraceae bacterium]
MPKYTFDNTFGELMEDPQVMEIVMDLCPELLNHPMKDAAMQIPVNVGLPFIEGMFPEETIEEFRRRLEAIE